MEIGEPQREFEAEPIRDPFKRETPRQVPAPAQPVKVPERVKEPAR